MALNRISVVYITDEKYAMPTCVSAYSLICNQEKETQIDIYFVINSISELSKAKFMELSEENVKIHIIEVQDDSYVELAKSCLTYKNIHVSYTAMFKFNLPKILEDEDKVIYIDGDTLIQKSLLALYNIPMEGYYIAAVDDILQKTYNFSPVNVESSYFNSGVMLLNLKRMREDNITEKLLDYRVRGTNFFMDQDAFNVVLGAKKISLPYIYNFMITLIDTFDVFEIVEMTKISKADSIEDIIDQMSILHLTNRAKPWVYYIPWFSESFKKYHDRSPYADEKLILLNPLKEYKNEIIMLKNRIDELNNSLQPKDELYLQPYEEKVFGKNIILYGAGQKGRNIRSKLEKICTIHAWVDKNYEQIANGEIKVSANVQSPDIIKTAGFDYVLIAIVNQDLLTDAKRYLCLELGVPREKIVTLYEVCR